MSYFAMSGVLAPMGIISAPMSEYFGLPITDITARFSWLTMGILGGAIIALFIFDWVQLKRLMIFVYSVICAALLSLYFVSDLNIISLTLGLIGVCSGIGLPGAALVISRTYRTEQRASMLVITDGCFSIAGIFCSWFAVFLLARSFHWSGVYLFVALVAATVALLSANSTLPATKTTPGDNAPALAWPRGVWLCLVALFLYTLGQWSVLLWLPNYVETTLQVAQSDAGRLVGQFWTGMLAAQIFVSWWVMKTGVRRLLIIAAVSTALFSVPLWLNGNMRWLLFLATLWGFANLGLLKITLSFATELVHIPSARLVSGLLLGATFGTAISPYVTSQIVEATSSLFVLQFGSGCYIAMTILLILASREYKDLKSPSAAIRQ